MHGGNEFQPSFLYVLILARAVSSGSISASLIGKTDAFTLLVCKAVLCFLFEATTFSCLRYVVPGIRCFFSLVLLGLCEEKKQEMSKEMALVELKTVDFGAYSTLYLTSFMSKGLCEKLFLYSHTKISNTTEIYIV